MLGQLRLVCDDREKSILKYPELAAVPHMVRRITTGDFCVIREGTAAPAMADQVLMCIERKTLDDFAASIKDGRIDNRDKMKALRQATGCLLVFLIEGDPFSSADKKYGNIPYRYIESCIFHMMMRDGIQVLWSRNSLGTAELLVRLVKSMATLGPDELTIGAASRTGGFAAPQSNDAAPLPQQHSLGQPMVPQQHSSFRPMDLLTAQHKASPESIVRAMWACIKRITVDSCQILGSNFSIEDVISRNIYPEITAKGLHVTKSVLKNLAAVSGDSQLHIRMLAVVPGISVNTAKKMIGQQPLISWLNVPKEKLGGEIGAKRAEAILDAFKRRLGTRDAALVASSAVAAPEPMTQQEIDLLAAMLKGPDYRP